MNRNAWLGSLVVALASCAPPEQVQTLQGLAQGTTYHLSFWTRQPLDLGALKSDVDRQLQQIDEEMSGYRADSVIEQFNQAADTTPHAVSTRLVSLVEKARTVYYASDGCYDLTVKPLLDLWGFTSDRFSPPSARAIQATLAYVGMDKLVTVDPSHLAKRIAKLEVDLSSIAQGYTAGRLADALQRHGIHDYLVEIGGELQVNGRKPGGRPWRVAVEKPLPDERSLEKVITVHSPQPLAVMTSGTYRHFFEAAGVRYSHILDARTGRPVEHRTVSVTVFYDDPSAADAWSTALLCLGSARGLAVADQQGIPALFIDQGDTGALQERSSRPLLALKSVEIE